MPNPGSKQYDNARRDMRSRLEKDEGIDRRHADELVNAELQGDEGDQTQAPNERAYGPKGER